jgi:hypothetical protein
MNNGGEITARNPFSTVSTWLSGFGWGVMFGAVLGVAFAPARGRDTRHRIGAATRDGHARAANMIGRCRTALSSRHARAIELIHTAGDHVRDVTGNIAYKTQAVRSFVSRK